MIELGVIVAVIRNDAVLLTRREDFDVWCLPGGSVEANESVHDAAVREVREETGLHVTITQLVGVYTRPFWGTGGSHIMVFAATSRTDVLDPDANEVLEADYFERPRLPEPLMWGHDRFIEAALHGGTGLVWHSDVRSAHVFESRAALYRWRDGLGVPRRDAYHRLIKQLGPQRMTVVVGSGL